MTWLSIARTSPASGQEASDPAGYRELVEDGLREYELGHHEEARSLFLRAHALFPNARTLRGIGMAEFELRRYGACLEQTEAALRSTVRPLDERLRAHTQQLHDRARSFVAYVIIETRPAAAKLTVDGLPVTEGGERPLVLDIGDHVIEGEVAGHAPEKRHIVVTGGETKTLTMLFNPLAPVAASAPAQRKRRWYQSPWLWTAVGTVAAGSIAGTAIALTGGDERTAPADGGSTAAVLSSR